MKEDKSLQIGCPRYKRTSSRAVSFFWSSVVTILALSCLLMRLAIFLVSVGGYVSGKINRPRIEDPKPTITISHISHRHPRCEFTINPPTIGPNVGPEKLRETAQAIATPRCCGFQQSAITPPRTAKGETSKRPAKKRPMRTVTAFFPRAGIRAINDDTASMSSIGYFRPNRSDSGEMIRKPNI